jgi:hypothetical protein
MRREGWIIEQSSCLLGLVIPASSLLHADEVIE